MANIPGQPGLATVPVCQNHSVKENDGCGSGANWNWKMYNATMLQSDRHH